MSTCELSPPPDTQRQRSATNEPWTHIAAQTSLREARSRGRGILLIRRYMTRADYSDRGNCLRMMLVRK